MVGIVSDVEEHGDYFVEAQGGLWDLRTRVGSVDAGNRREFERCLRSQFRNGGPVPMMRRQALGREGFEDKRLN